MKEEVKFLRSQIESGFLLLSPHADLQRQLTGYKAQLAKLKDNNHSLEIEDRKTKHGLYLVQEECHKLRNNVERSELYARSLKRDLEMQIQAHGSLKQRSRQDIIVEDTDLRSREESLRNNWSQLVKEKQQWGEEKNILTMENGELKRKIAHLERASKQLEKSKSQRSMSESEQYTTSQQAPFPYSSSSVSVVTGLGRICIETITKYKH